MDTTTNGIVDTPEIRRKPKLSFWDIWNMSFGFLGIQFGFALQNANVSRIFETLGGETSKLAVYWLAAPVTGLLVQPIIGYLSDRTWHPRWGRRRPYFMIGAVLATIALFLMPNAWGLYMAIGTLWILDSSINISMEPFRAFVGDNLPSEQRTTGFVMQSFFIGLGAVVASALPWIFTNWLGVDNTAPAGMIPDSVKWSFYIGGVVFFGAVAWTVFNSKEYSPEELASFEENQEKEEEFKVVLEGPEAYAKNGSKKLIEGLIFLVAGALLTFLFQRAAVEQEVYILSAGLGLFGVLQIVSGLLQRAGTYENGFVTIMNDFGNMPATMKQLAGVQFFSWFALFAMWIYTTAAVTSHIYGTSDTTTKLYNDGADWVTVCFAIYNGVAALVAFVLPVIAKKTSRKLTHAICLMIGALGLVSVYFMTDPNWLLLSMVGIGIAWASILSMPYAILTGCLPADKMGYYMGVFNFFIVIPQIVAASVLGFILGRFFGEEAIYAMFIGGVSFVLAAILTLWVKDVDA